MVYAWLASCNDIRTDVELLPLKGLLERKIQNGCNEITIISSSLIERDPSFHTRKKNDTFL